MAFDFLRFVLGFLKLFFVLEDDRFRGLADEVLITKLRFDAEGVVFGLLEFFLKTDLFFFHIQDALKVDIELDVPDEHVGALARCVSPFFEDVYRLDTREFLDDPYLAREEVAVGCDESDRYLFDRVDVIGGTDISDSGDERLRAVSESCGDIATEMGCVRDIFRPFLNHEQRDAFSPQLPPEGFGDERHKRVPEFEQRFEYVSEHGIILLYLVNLNVPIGEFIPGEVAQGFAGYGEVVLFQVACHFINDGVEAQADEMIGCRDGFRRRIRRFGLRHDVAPDIPELIGEVMEADDFFCAEFDIVSRGGADDERKTERIGAVFGDDIERVDDIA